METFLGMIHMVGFNFAPRGFANCDGQLLSISSNSALFSLLGTTYGGNGQTTFGLPDLRGRVALHVGQGNGLPSYSQGQIGGSPTTTLLTSNLPPHNHILNGVSDAGDVSLPTGAFSASSGGLDPEYRISGTTVQMNPAAISPTGGGQSFNSMPPYQVVRYIIALQGIFPSRN